MAGDGCRAHALFVAGCADCRRYAADYDRRRRRKIAAGVWLPPVPTQTVRDHLEQLRSAGMSLAAISRAAGISNRTVRAICNQPRQSLHGPTAAAILAVSLSGDTLPAGMVDACGTTRRIQGLVAIGYSLADIGARLDRQVQQVWGWAWGHQATVTAASAEAVTALFERLSGTPGASVRARNDAHRRGWMPPLAWDDIDDPAAQPDLGGDAAAVVDLAAVERALDGQRVTLTTLERHYAVHAGREQGMSYGVIANALRMSGSTVKDLGAKPLPEGCEVAA